MKSSIESNLFLINHKITKACQIYKRKAASVNLVAVSKTSSAQKIYQAIDLGCKIFGENYVKEAQEKWPEIKKNFPEIKLHFIGHLQSNKAGEAVDLFDCIETLDSQKLALALKKEIAKKQKNPEIFIQINIGEEPQKGGILPSEFAEFLNFCRNQCALNVTGLMCIPPSNEAASPYFALLCKMARENNLPKISMGMSADFEDAIALGSTHIRLGTAIFGARGELNAGE
jgi:pyridoxal phosphate enzyme (YggS family)